MEITKNERHNVIPSQENLVYLFLMLSDELQIQPKWFHLYSFIKLSRNKEFVHFLAIINSIKWLPGKW